MDGEENEVGLPRSARGATVLERENIAITLQYERDRIRGRAGNAEKCVERQNGWWFNCGRAVDDESAMTFEACRLADVSNTEITANRSKHHEEKQLVLAGAHRIVQWLRLPLPALVSLANM